jgi:ribonuclease-3 family protein
MEEDIIFKSSAVDAKMLNPAQLAYIGDAVYEIYIRHYLLTLGIAKSAKLQQEAEALVRAGTQSKALKLIMPMLDEEENKIVLRGRNNKHKNKPQSATVEEYNNATGLEALIGYLYLCGRREKIDEIISRIITQFGKG